MPGGDATRPILFIAIIHDADNYRFFWGEIICRQAAKAKIHKSFIISDIFPVAEHCNLGKISFQYQAILISMGIRSPSAVTHLIISYPDVIIPVRTFFKGTDHRWT